MVLRIKHIFQGLALVALVAISSIAAAQTPPPEPRPQPGLKWTDDEIRQIVAPMRAGRTLSTGRWPNGARVAVCLSWDMDMESFLLLRGVTAPVSLSQGEFGAHDGLRRIMALYDRHKIPGSFYIPAVSGLLYPHMVEEFRKRPQHEVGIHGWMHESLIDLNDRDEEERLMNKAIDFWTKSLGKRPVGFRAPGWAFSQHTLDLIRKAGFEYDSSAMAMDQPYEIMSNGKATGLIELPVDFILDDAPYVKVPGGVLPSPELAFKVYRDEFDEAYKEGTMFMLTMHPMITGRRSRMVHLDRLITYMKSKPGVWFATGEEIARYLREQNKLAR